jgi:hypothetical protein
MVISARKHIINNGDNDENKNKNKNKNKKVVITNVRTRIDLA